MNAEQYDGYSQKYGTRNGLICAGIPAQQPPRPTRNYKLSLVQLEEMVVGLVVTSACSAAILSVFSVVTARASDASSIVDTAKFMAGLGPIELMAVVTLASLGALVIVVKVFVGRFLKSMDELTTELKKHPCLYMKHAPRDEEE